MKQSVHWLIEAAQRAKPDTTVPASVDIALNLGDAWQQVCVSAPIQY